MFFIFYFAIFCIYSKLLTIEITKEIEYLLKKRKKLFQLNTEIDLAYSSCLSKPTEVSKKRTKDEEKESNCLWKENGNPK